MQRSSSPAPPTASRRVALSGKALKAATSSNRERGSERRVIILFVDIGPLRVRELVVVA